MARETWRLGLGALRTQRRGYRADSWHGYGGLGNMLAVRLEGG